MKQFVALAVVACIGSAIALPLLDTAVTNGVLLEEQASRPTFAKGIRTDCDYIHHTGRTLGDVHARGDNTIYADLAKAKYECNDMGDDCGGVLETAGQGPDDSEGYQLFAGHKLKNAHDSQEVTLHLKTLCAFPLPNSNFRSGESQHGRHAIYELNPVVQDLRWKLSNGPVFARHDDGRDHGFASRLTDAKSHALSVEDCMELCKDRSDCASGNYCAAGTTGAAGTCFLSGDWDPHGKQVDETACTTTQNFRKRHDWVKPVMRTDDGQYIKHQWHSKKTIDDAAAEEQSYDYSDDYDNVGAAL
jgi:hypothetical protein